MRILLTVFGVCLLTWLSAQSDQDWPLVEDINFTINPAMTVDANDLKVVMTHAKKWRRISSSPTQSGISVLMPFANENMGWGAQVFSESVGPFQTAGGRLSYGYKIQLSSRRADHLALGLSARIMHMRFDHDHLISQDVTDPLLSDIETSGLVPPAFSTGFSYVTGVPTYTHPVQFKIAGAASRILPFEDRFGSFSLERSFRIHGLVGMKIAASSSTFIEPSAMYSHLKHRPSNITFRLKALRSRVGWLMTQYERSKVLTTQLGFNLGLGAANIDVIQVSFSNAWYLGAINGQLGNSFTFGVTYQRAYRTTNQALF